MRDRLDMAVGLIRSEDLAHPAFYGSKGEETTTSSPFFAPQNLAQESAKISGDPIQNVCSQGILAVQLLANGTFSGANTGASGIQGD